MYIAAFAVVLGIAIALFLWRRRRRSSHHYSFPERSAVIVDALKQGSALAIVYWSKSQGKYLRRVVTPLDLDMDSLKAFDHTLQDVRLFKVIRIRQITVLPPGSHESPPRLVASIAMRVVAVCVFAVLAVAAAMLFRKIGPHATPSANRQEAPVKDFSTLPPSVTNHTESTAELWDIVVDDDAGYNTTAVAQILEAGLKCTPAEAQMYVRTIRSAGHAPVWRGEWAEVERIRQFLEGEDLVARLERVESK